MIKILYIVSTLGNSGPTNQLFNIIKYLDRHIFIPCIVTLSPEPKDSRWGDFQNLGVDMKSFMFSRMRGAILSKRELNSLVKDFKPHIIHSQGIRSDSICSKLDLKKVCTAHCFLGEDYRMTYGRLAGRLMTTAHVNAIKKFDICVTVSDAVASYLRESHNIGNTQTVLNGVDGDIFYPALSSEKIELRSKLGLPEKGKIWVTSGNLSERKNQMFLIKIWKQRFLESANHLVILGDGILRESFEAEASGIDNIHILGSVKNVRDYLAASDYYISASKAEGLPLSVIEAASCGLPVLLSNIQPHKELFNTKAEIGELFEEDSEDSFSKGMNALLSSIYEDISNNILQMVREHFCASQMSENYQKIYKTIIGQAE